MTSLSHGRILDNRGIAAKFCKPDNRLLGMSRGVKSSDDSTINDENYYFLHIKFVLYLLLLNINMYTIIIEISKNLNNLIKRC